MLFTSRYNTETTNIKHLYQLAFRLLQTDEGASFSILLSLVLSNNLGHVLKDMDDHQRANQCFEQLLSAIVYITDCKAHEDVEGHDLRGFIQSTSHLVLKTSAAAAA